jgi:WD domain, G-beta repeat
MRSVRWRLAASIAVVVVAMCGLGLQSGQPPMEAKQATLPKGALRQLGEVRFANLGHILAVAFSPDGRTIAGGSWDETIRIWDAGTGKEIAQLTGHNAYVKNVQFSPDGKFLVTGGGDRKLRLWDCATWKPLRSFEASTPDTGIAISGDSKWLAGRTAKDLLVWDLATGKERWRQTKVGFTLIAGFSLDGKELICLTVRDSNWHVVFRDATTGKELRVRDTEQRSLHPSAIALHDLNLLVGAWSAVDYYDLATGRRKTKVLPESGVERVAFSPNGKMIAVCGPAEVIQVWETATLNERCRFQSVEPGNIPLAFSPNCQLLASGSTDSTVMLWDIAGIHTAGGKITADTLASMWNDLASTDAAKGYRAMATVMGHAESALPYLKERIKPAKATVDAATIERLIADLASEQFAVRDKAAKELSMLGDLAEVPLRSALEKKSTLEVRQRLQKLLGVLEAARANPPPEMLRLLRAVEAVESVGDKAARELLRTWADGVPGAVLTVEARAALVHLAAR